MLLEAFAKPESVQVACRRGMQHEQQRQTVGGETNQVDQARETFTMEDVLPLFDADSGREVPSYQAYLVLAWLRSAGVVVQHGRQGYSLEKGTDLDAVVERQWGLGRIEGS